ncbi:glycolate oxidase subunit GlcD [Desulfuribacillus stibiiarsenatis]|uniref:Glycolate oxidase subunit GlcD n=1 Tax=Desulfuribacillus stibiiarsenatis TaxID=1390249 RepID=A0A1E5L330_9FIRM|nr:FAD-linked oxidase C-terminal domain-containing protein [Desulfuribacillus stibiiarsenatis]OEH84481.1 glycolate oxidase subunit GlcD [Desulfuribacillus stibiiarsenatis]
MNKKLIDELIAAIGSENVLYDDADLVSYSFDATPDMPSQRPDAIVTPMTTEHVIKIMKIADQYDAPIYTRGAGTNLSGGTIPINKGIVLLMVKMDKILEVDAENLTATVEPGVIIQDLNDAVMVHGLIYPPDPGTVKTATMGGSVAENSGGLRGLKYGVTKHYVMGMELVMANGDLVKFGGKTVKNVTAYDFVKLFTGSEGTLGIITKIIVKLIPAPEHRKTMLASFQTLDDAGNTVSNIVAGKVIPATLEILDNTTIKVVENYTKAGLPVDAEAILLIEVDGIAEVVEKEAKIVEEVVKKNNGKLQIAQTDEERDKLWAARRAALPALAQVSPTTVLEDATVPRSEITAMLRELKRIAEQYNLHIGTFGHAGDGNLHPTILTDERNKEEMERVHKAVDEIFAAALKLGGTLTGEHGIGMAKMRYLGWELGEEGLAVMRKVKEALDPKYLLNPGKMVQRSE